MLIDDLHSSVLFNNFSSNQTKNNVINNQFNKFNKDINKSDSKLNNNSSVTNSTIHFNSSNLINIVDKNNKSKVLFNNTSNNQNQFNKTCKLLGLNNISHGNNTTIFKKVNITSDNLTSNDFNISLVNKNNKLLYNDLTNKDVNISKNNIKSDNITVVNKINNHELSKFNNTTDINKSSVINVYLNTSNLDNNSNVLFNDTSLNQSQYNKSLKVFELDKDSSVNDNSIGLN